MANRRDADGRRVVVLCYSFVCRGNERMGVGEAKKLAVLLYMRSEG